ncbi:MAG TPA: hypothetical protein VF681_04945 [Abditibacteriaceae bacterium]|jgi:hypothetical protein
MTNTSIARKSAAQMWDETNRLALEIEELQIRLELLMDNAPTEEAEDQWNVWPYSWAVAGWNSARNCFHSFHENRIGKPRAEVCEGAPQLRLL